MLDEPTPVDLTSGSKLTRNRASCHGGVVSAGDLRACDAQLVQRGLACVFECRERSDDVGSATTEMGAQPYIGLAEQDFGVVVHLFTCFRQANEVRPLVARVP
jgi:hypothetical protein